MIFLNVGHACDNLNFKQVGRKCFKVMQYLKGSVNNQIPRFRLTLGLLQDVSPVKATC